MTIKLMLNKDEEINRLAQDPTVEIKIKAAIIDAIAKRAVKALDSGDISDSINEALKTALFEDKTAWRPILKADIGRAVETAAKNALDERLHELLVDALPRYETQFRQILEKHLQELEKVDYVAMAQRAVNSYIVARLSR